jgi:hypothetical protein
VFNGLTEFLTQTKHLLFYTFRVNRLASSWSDFKTSYQRASKKLRLA